MTQVTYSQQHLRCKSLAQLKRIYSEIGCTVEVADRRCKDEWRSAIAQYQASILQKVARSAPDEQAIAQDELNRYIADQAEGIAPTTDPLTSRDRRIIGEIIQVDPESICTMWIEGGITVWVQFVDNGRLPFDRDWFASRVAEVKATLPETPNNSQFAVRNSQLNTFTNYELQVEIEELAPQNNQLNNIHNCELR